jgi:hypothetical protein
MSKKEKQVFPIDTKIVVPGFQDNQRNVRVKADIIINMKGGELKAGLIRFEKWGGKSHP